MSNQKKELQKFRQINLRVGEEVGAKLDDLKQASGKSISSIIRELVVNGEVKNIYNGKALIKDVAALHNKMNQYALTFADEVQKVKVDIKDIKMVMQEKNINEEQLAFCLEKVDRRLDDVQEDFNQKIVVCTRVLGEGGRNGNF